MRHLSLARAVSALSAALCLTYAGCAPGKINEGVLVASVTISPKTLALTPGRSAQLNGRVFDDAGAPISAPLTWQTASQAVAVVSNSGLVTAVGFGSTQITVSSG